MHFMLKSAHITSCVSLGVAIAVAAALLLAISVSPSKTNHASPGSPRSGSAPAPDTAAVPLNCDKSVGTTPAKVHPGCFDPATGEVILPDTVKQLVVIGDLHGDIAAAMGTLKLLGVIEVSDSDRFYPDLNPERSHPAWKYIGGPTMMVFLTGDYMDRGPHGAVIIEMLLDLAAQAQKVGTNVHLLMGNHEYWQFLQTNHYNHINEFKDFLLELPEGVPAPSWNTQQQLGQHKGNDNAYKYYQAGIIARRDALFRSEDGKLKMGQVLARMISNMPLLIKVGPILISHAGVTKELAKDASSMGKGIAAYVQEMKSRIWPDVVKGNPAPALDNIDTSVIYNRKLMLPNEASKAGRALKSHGIDLQLIGHNAMTTKPNGYEPTLLDKCVVVNDLALSLWMNSPVKRRQEHTVGGLVVYVSNREQPTVYANTRKTGMRQIWPELSKMPEQFVQ